MPNLHVNLRWEHPTGRTHGIRATYVNGRCTDGPQGAPCDDCRRANADYLRQYRRKTKTITNACNTPMAS